MTNELFELLSLYIDGGTKLEVVDDWIAVHIWDADHKDRDIIDQVVVELSYVKDNVSDEASFRIRMSELVSPNVRVELAVSEPKPLISMATSSNDVDLDVKTWVIGGVVNHRVAHRFA